MHTFEDRYTNLTSKSIKMLRTRIHTRAKAGNLALDQDIKVLTRESRRFFWLNFSLDDNMVTGRLLQWFNRS